MNKNKTAYIIAGLPGSGKSVYATELSKRLNIPCFDPDHNMGYQVSQYLKQKRIRGSFICPLMFISRQERLLFKNKFQDYNLKLILFSENRVNCLKNTLIKINTKTSPEIIFNLFFHPYDFPLNDEYDQIELIEVKNHLDENTVNAIVKGSIAEFFYLIIQGYEYQINKKVSEALNFYQQVINTLKPDTAIKKAFLIISLIQSSRCYIALKDQGNTLKVLQQAYELDNNYKITILHLMKYYLLNNNLKESLNYFQKLSGGKGNQDEFNRLSILKPDSIEYKQTIVQLLAELEHVKGWTLEEKNNLRLIKEEKKAELKN
jgi:tetratricopeptide (TPR) repeat protein